MTTKFPIVSLNVMKELFPQHKEEAQQITENGLWFYSVPDNQFISYVPNINLCVNDVKPVLQNLKEEEVSFVLRPFSSVVEVTVRERFPSSFLTAQNAETLAENVIDVTNELHVLILNNITAPIMLGSESALKRLLITSDDDSYYLVSFKNFLEGRG